MYRFGNRSMANIETLCDELQEILHEAIKSPPIDFAVICGHRGEKEQNAAYKKGRSKLKFPQSKHNSSPADAFDFVPWHSSKPHVRWDDINAFRAVVHHLKKTAYRLGYEIECGADWRTFKDYPHVHIVRR